MRVFTYCRVYSKTVNWTNIKCRLNFCPGLLPVNTLQHDYRQRLCAVVSHGSKTRHDTIGSFSSDGSVRACRGAVTLVTRGFSPGKPSSRGGETPWRVSSGPALFLIAQSSRPHSRSRCNLSNFSCHSNWFMLKVWSVLQLTVWLSIHQHIIYIPLRDGQFIDMTSLSEQDVPSFPCF